MSRKYQTMVAIELNTKGEIELVKDAENGTLDPANGEEILALMEKLAKDQKTTVSKWSYFCPVIGPNGQPVIETDKAGKPVLNKKGKPVTKQLPFDDAKAREGRTILILANSFGKPYVAVMPAGGERETAKKGPQRKRLA